MVTDCTSLIILNLGEPDHSKPFGILLKDFLYIFHKKKDFSGLCRIYKIEKNNIYFEPTIWIIWHKQIYNELLNIVLGYYKKRGWVF